MSAFKITATPNPNSIRVGCEKKISASPQTFTTAEEAAADPIAKDLFAIPGITQVFMLNDFISINKDGSNGWPVIQPEVEKVMEKHLS